MCESSTRNLVVLPHLHVEEVIELGDFFLCSSADIENIPKRYHDHVRCFSHMYRSHLHDIDSVGLLLRTRKTSRLHELTTVELRKIEMLIDSLAFSAILRQHTFALATDNFAYTVWEFQGDKKPSDHVALSSRRYQINVVENVPHMIQLPLHVHYSGIRQSQIDGAVLPLLLQCVESSSAEDARLMRAIHWYMRAHTDTGDVSDHTRFAMTAIAFEALLNTPTRGGITQYFVRTTQLLLGESEQLEAWAKEFYEVRSQVVHGRELPELMFGKYQHNSLLNLADIVFVQCVFRTLSLRGLWTDPVVERVRRESVVSYLISNRERCDAIRRYRLRNPNLDEATAVTNHMYTIQKNDASLSRQDCEMAIVAILDLALAGLRSLSRAQDIVGTTRANIVRSYRDRFRAIKGDIRGGREIRLHQRLIGLPRDDDDEWGDAIVRGLHFGAARVLNLDTVISALRQLSDIHVRLVHNI